MKKFLVSFFVITAFITYSIYQRIFAIQSSIPVSLTTTLTPSPEPIQSNLFIQNSPTPQQKLSLSYKDGKYIGDAVDVFYGNIQVETTILNGKITNIQFLQYPNDRGTSLRINQESNPMLAQEAIRAQSAQVDIVTGATDSSQGFIQSLQSALDKAKS